MADLNLIDYIKTLQAQNSQDDIWSGVGQSVLKSNVVNNSPYADPTQNAIASTLQGLFGGALLGYGQHEKDIYNEQLANTLVPMIKAQDSSLVSQPGDMSDSDFSALKASADIFKSEKAQEQTDKQGQLDDAIKLEVAKVADPRVIAAKNEEAQNAADAKKFGIKGSALSQKTIGELSKTLASLSALQDTDKRIDNLEGPDNWLGGIERSALSVFDPNSNIATYEKGLPATADPITVGLTGSGRQSSLQNTINSYTPSLFTSKTAMHNVSDQYRQSLMDKASKLMDSLQQAGYPLEDLQPLADKLSASSDPIDASRPPSSPPLTGTLDTSPKLKASDLLAQGYVRGPSGWVKP